MHTWTNGISSHSIRTLIVLTCLTVASYLAAQEAVTQETESQAIEALLQQTAEAFIDKDVPLIELSFAENFAGPFRVPKLAQGILKRVVNASEQISVDYQLSPPDIVEDRAVATVNLNIDFQFKGGANKDHNAEYLTFFHNELRGWLIAAMERLDPSWELEPDSNGIVTWQNEQVRFPAPKGWEGYPTISAETKKSVIFVSHDLKATIGIGLIQLPIPMELDAVVANQKSVPQLYPGSAFVGQTPATLDSKTGLQTELDLKIGSQLSRIRSVFAMRGQALYVISMSATPVSEINTYQESFETVLKGFKFLGTDPAETTPSAPVTTFADSSTGLSLTAPEGWHIVEMDQNAATKQGWLFGTSLKPAQGNSFVLVGARALPNVLTPKDLPALQEEEMKNIQMAADDAKVLEGSDIKVAGLLARSWVYTFTIGQKRTRREVFFTEGKRLFFVIADAVPASDYPTLAPDIDTVLRSIRLKTKE